MAPDLDLLLRLFDGVNHHRGPSHSLAAAVIAGVVGFLLARSGASVPGGVWLTLAWASHTLLDFLGVDTTPPVGEMALWPFSLDFFASPVSVFYDVGRAPTLEMIRHNLIAVSIELIVLVPIVILCWRPAVRRTS